MEIVRMVWGIIWRSLLVGLGHVLAWIVADYARSIMMGQSNAPINLSNYTGMFIPGILIGVFLVPLASQMPASRWRHFMVWTSVIFFNLGSVAIEGAFFLPELITIPLTILFVQQLIVSVATALLISLLGAKTGETVALIKSLNMRPWYSWLGCLLIGSLAYFVFYYVFGAINFRLVTEPYYTAHAGGLFVPAAERVLLAETVRAPLIVISAVLFLWSKRAEKRQVAILTGLIIFWIGGIVPLALQFNVLPFPLIAASAVEIFFQNFLTGVVLAYLFWTPLLHQPSRSDTAEKVTFDVQKVKA
jgi:hypothetical protein